MGVHPDDDPPACGVSFDHDLSWLGEAGGVTAVECRECGTDGFNPPNDEED